MRQTIKCFRCGSHRVVRGNVLGHKGRRPLFRPRKSKFFKLAWTSPHLKVEHDSYVCLDCGLFWSITDAATARKKVDQWGKEDLKERLGLN